jgi:uncharacterized protein YjbI with pentapeptide repeats
MGNTEHVARLKKGLRAWNDWRLMKQETAVDLSFEDLSDLDLSGSPDKQLFDTRYHLALADMRGTKFRGSNLDYALMLASDLRYADLTAARMENAYCNSANLTWANLEGVRAPYIDLIGANLAGANLRNADLSHAFLGATVFARTNLAGVRGLSSCKHYDASSIDFETIASNPNIPLSFLVNCGLDHVAAELQLELARRRRETVSCFISYSTKNELFCEKLNRDIRKNGIHSWFAPDRMKVGDKMLDTIDRAIESSSKVILVLSSDSLGSSWVEDEVTRAFAIERAKGTQILLPIRIDSDVLQSEKGWAKKLRDSRHIGDFTKWKSRTHYAKSFATLISAIRARK